MKHITFLLLWFMGILNVRAQFDPANPSEPNLNYKYRVEVSTNYPTQTYCSGAGKYAEGSQVRIGTSSRNPSYQFSHWTLNEVEYTTSLNFTYTMGADHAVFKAHYIYNPVAPNEPTAILRNRLFLEAKPQGMASFNRTSGDRHVVDSYIQLSANANQGFHFLGWYEGPLLVSSTNSFRYCMPARDVTLTARFRYDPTNPDEPSGSGQEGVQEHSHGDINADGTVDVSDAVLLLNYYLAGTPSPEIITRCDMNADGTVDVTDSVQVLNKYMEEE